MGNSDFKEKALESKSLKAQLLTAEARTAEAAQQGPSLGKAKAEKVPVKTTNYGTDRLSTADPEPDVIFTVPETVVGSSYNRTCMGPHQGWLEVSSFHKHRCSRQLRWESPKKT